MIPRRKILCSRRHLPTGRHGCGMRWEEALQRERTWRTVAFLASGGTDLPGAPLLTRAFPFLPSGELTRFPRAGFHFLGSCTTSSGSRATKRAVILPVATPTGPDLTARSKSREDQPRRPKGGRNVFLLEAVSAAGDRTGSDANEFRLAGAQRRV